MKILKSLISLIFILNVVFSARLIPDPQNPLQIYIPTTKDGGAVIKIKFSFAANSRGLVQGQYFALEFPNQFNLGLKSAARISAFSMYDETNKMYLDVDRKEGSVDGKVDTSLLAEENVAFIRYMGSNIVVNPNVIYTFSITYANKLYIQWIHQVKFFTSTSNTPEKIIIDYANFMGTYALYGDYTSVSPALEIASSSVLIANSSTDLFPNSIFDLAITLRANAQFYENDTIITLEFPSFVNVAIPSTIVTSGESSGLKAKVKGLLSSRIFTNSNTMVLENFGEDFTPGREISFTIKSWKANGTKVDVTENLVVKAWYKNTYALISYQTAPIFTTKSALLNVIVQHPNNIDVYRGGAYPIQFTFSSLNNLGPGFLTIQHSNALLDDNTSNLAVGLSFLASTCDFSENLNMDNGFNIRPICYALRKDFNYPTISSGDDKFTTSYLGSGIFFPFKNLIMGTNYTVTVWAFFNNCGGMNNNLLTTSADKKPYTQMEFTVSYYNSIDITQTNENVFNSAVLLAVTSSPIQMVNRCYNTNNNYNYVYNDSNKQVSVIMKEYYDWSISNQTRKTEGIDCNTCFEFNISNSFTESFLYTSNSSKKLAASSYFSMSAYLWRSAGTKTLKNTFPLNVGNSGAKDIFLTGRLGVQFAGKWFKISNSDPISTSSVAPAIPCYLSWASSANNQNKLFSEGNTTTPADNVISAKNSQIELSGDYTKIGTDFIRIVSNFYKNADGLTTPSWTFLKNSSIKSNGDLQWNDSNVSTIIFGSFTTCIQWDTIPTTIKSFYVNIDIQFKWYLTQSAIDKIDGTAVRVARFIKLFPEAMVFNDYAKINTHGYQATLNPIINHFMYRSASDGTANTLCLLEINGSSLGLSALGGNTLSVWLQGATLFEVDYHSFGNSYPAGPLVSTVSSYGLQSAHPYDTDNNLFGGSGSNEYDNFYKKTVYIDFQTSYLAYMGSQILFTSVGNGNLTSVNNGSAPNLFIPYYCPLQNNNDKTSNLYLSPSFTAAWFDSNSYSKINSLTGFVYFTDSVNENSSQRTTRFVFNSLYGITSTYSSSLGYSWNSNLAFNSYTGNDFINISFSQASINNINTTQIDCTAYIFLASNNISFDSIDRFIHSDLIGNNYSVAMYNSNAGNKSFYTYGKLFNKAYFISTENISLTQDKRYSITGIKRITTDKLVNGFSFNDKLAFTCINYDKNKNNNLNNFNISLEEFTLTVDSDTITNWVGSYSGDKIEQLKDDNAGNVKLTISAPNNIVVPVRSTLAFFGDGFTANSVCGIVNLAGLADPCANDAINGQIVCSNNSISGTFNICCYNVNVSGPLQKINKFIVSYGDITLLDANGFINGGGLIFNSKNNDLPDYNNNPSKFASVSDISYQLSSTEGSIGKVIIKVSLPREISRDMRIEFTGNYSNLLINIASPYTPRCLVTVSNTDNNNNNFSSTFGSNWDNGDFLIDSCSINFNASATIPPIVITTKNVIYKCGLSFSNKTLSVILWPVVLYDWSLAVGEYKIRMLSNSQTPTANNGIAFTMPKTPFTSKVKATQWDNLCNVSVDTTPSPQKIPGEKASYVFQFDLTNTSSNANEFAIFYDYKVYGPKIDELWCTSGNSWINCYQPEEGVILVRFTSAITSKSITVIISGWINPWTDSDIFFGCNINNTIYANSSTALVTGSGKLAGGVSLSKLTVNNSGNLRFLSVTPTISDTNPRINSNIHTFRFTFDTANGFTTIPTSVTNPVIIVAFPPEYKLYWSTTPITASIDEYSRDETKGIIKSKSFTPKTVETDGNRVYINFAEAEITIPTSFIYYDVKINYVLSPKENLSTGSFAIYLTNASLTFFYRTYSNLNTYSVNKLTNPLDEYLAFQRGNTFNFDNNKWILDIVGNTNETPNTITIKSGRYFKYFYSVKQNPLIIEAAATTVGINDAIFKATPSSSKIVTSTFENVPFLIGVTCGTAEGEYLINFLLNSDKFAPLTPIPVSVKNIAGVITLVTTTANLPPNSFSLSYVYLDNPNFDALTINSSAVTNPANDSTSAFSQIVIKPATITPNVDIPSTVYGTFSIGGTTTKSPQLFTAKDPNDCYKISNPNLSFNIGDTFPSFDAAKFASSFSYFDNTSDPKLAKNAIRIEYQTPVPHTMLNCALFCSSQSTFADSLILNPGAETNNVKYYSNYYASTKIINPDKIVFSDLVRGQTYNLKCIFRSTQAKESDRSQASILFQNFALGNSTVSIKPKETEPTQCAQFSFDNTNWSLPSALAKLMIDKCQRLFTVNGWSKNGCVNCVDSTITYINTGMTFPGDISCLVPAKSKLRFLHDNNTTRITQSTSSNIAFFSVCVVPTPLCATDVNTPKTLSEILDTEFIQGLKSPSQFMTTFGSVAANVPVVNVVKLVDDFAPDITKLNHYLVSKDKTGAFAFILSYNDNGKTIKCSYRIATAKQTFSTISSCSDVSRCGSNLISTANLTITSFYSSMKQFEYETLYYIYVGCMNNVPYAQKFTDIISVGNFTFKSPLDVPTTNTSVCQNATKIWPDCSSSCIEFGYFAILIIFAILLN